MRTLDVKYMLDIVPEILGGLKACVTISVVAIVFGLLLGLLLALTRVYKIPVLKRLSVIYISLFRGTPLMVQILIIYYGLPIIVQWISYGLNNLGFNVSLDISGIDAIYYMYVSFALCNAAYFAEIIRSAIMAVDSGQMEACYSIGMTKLQGMFRIVLPQAIASAVPNIGNTSIDIVKNTSLCFAVGIPEMLGKAKIIAGRTSKYFEAYIVAGIIYWVICYILEIVLKKVEQKSRKHER